MSVDLELTVIREADDDAGFLAAFAETDQMLVAVGGDSHGPAVLASSNARTFQLRTTPQGLGLRDAIVVGDAVWVCGEYGQLAVTRDHGRTWTLFETKTEQCLFSLALGTDGAVWCVGDAGTVLRVRGSEPVRVEFDTDTRLAKVYAVRDEIVALGGDGKIRRWRDGVVIMTSTGSSKPLTALAVTKTAWVVVGDGGFIARSPDGQWFSRVRTESEVDLEGITLLRDGRLVLVGDRGTVLTSLDEGRTWQAFVTGLPLVHLWSVQRFGAGALIGGDDGLVLRLAPPDDPHWADRPGAQPSVDVAGEIVVRDGTLLRAPGEASGVLSLVDGVFRAGPENFIARGLAPYLAALGERTGTEDRFTPGPARDFAEMYGVPLPSDAEAFFHAIAGANRWSTFEELRLDREIRIGGAGNLFEHMILNDQRSSLGTELVEAFCGVFGLGSQGNGDTYHMEIYEWQEGARQVLHFDHETGSFSGVIARSLDCLVYLCALVHAHEANLVEAATFTQGIRALRGKVEPTWHFAMEEKDPEFVAYDAERRDSEFFFFRARWICEVLANRHRDLDAVKEMFSPDFNQSTPASQLPARFEACEKYIPTALYAMWRAFLFDEPELAQYVTIGKAHAARVVRDAAALVEELRGGRNTLGTITDVRAWLAAFRALDIDPRRADARAEEAKVRLALISAREREVDAELDATPRAMWPALAWSWMDDGVAHRRLLLRIAQSDASIIAQLDALDDLNDAERAAAIPRLARELSPEIEALLVGRLVRDDLLDDVLVRGAAPEPIEADLDEPDEGDDDESEDDDDESDDESDDGSPGWEAIDAVLGPIYGGAEPFHVGAVVPYGLGGEDPLPGISAYPRTDPVPHWHFVTYGFTDLHEKQTDNLEESGFGFELTFRLARTAEQRDDDAQPPTWVFNFLQNLARYVFSTGNRFGPNHKMGLNGPIALEDETQITAICFTDDPELGDIDSLFGAARFLQIVGITNDEYKQIQDWSTPGLIDILRSKLPLLVTDLARPSVLADPVTAALVEARITAEGSSEELAFGGDMQLRDPDLSDGRVRIEIGALYAAAFPRAMRGRIRHGRRYEIRGRELTLRFEPASVAEYELADGILTLRITPELAREIDVQLRTTLVGTYDFEAWPALEITVTPSYIKAQDGVVIEVKGIGDPARAAQMIAEENARIAASAADDADDDDDNDDDEPDDALPPPDPARVIEATRISARALRFAPADPDVQFTHAMLLLDADGAGLPGTLDDLLARMPQFAPSTRVNVALRMGARPHERFAAAVALVLAHPVTDVQGDLVRDLGKAILAHAPAHGAAFTELVLSLPVDGLGALRDAPELEELFRDWHARREGN